MQTAAVARLERAVPEPLAGPPVLMLSAAGAMVPLRQGAWGEVTILAIGVMAPDPAAPGAVRATPLSYFSRRAEAATFTRQSLGETHRRGMATAGVVQLLGDGSL